MENVDHVDPADREEPRSSRWQKILFALIVLVGCVKIARPAVKVAKHFLWDKPAVAAPVQPEDRPQPVAMPVRPDEMP